MSFKKFIPIPIFIAFQAFGLMILVPYIPGTPEALAPAPGGLITWIAFQAWAMYFMAGCTITNGIKVIIGYAGGIIASIGIFELSAVLGNHFGETWGLNVAVLILVVPIICVERIPLLNFVPAWFVGAGVFFALCTYKNPDIETSYMELAKPEMIACCVGLLFGFVTVVARKSYEGRVNKKEAKPQEA